MRITLNSYAQTHHTNQDHKYDKTAPKIILVFTISSAVLHWAILDKYSL
jgi:hypothetical protein